MSIEHCVSTITRLVEENRSDPRALLQIGYNLGRLSELTGLGREPFWDRWKEPVSRWDQPYLMELARELHAFLEATPPTTKPLDPPGAPPEASR
jgi:hypothetical protein